MGANNREACMTEKKPISSTELEALSQRFQDHSRTAQAYYSVMHAARGITGSDAEASAWMEQAAPAFNGKSPAVLIREGRVEEVLAYIGSLKT
jgi:uncharacterized protein (DUF2384 family)